MPSFKTPFEFHASAVSAQEYSGPPTTAQQTPHRSFLTRIIDSIRLALTLLTLLCGITILGTTADTLSVYNTTHLGQDFFLPLWPKTFEVRPTVAMVVCSSIIVVASGVALLVTRIAPLAHNPLLTLILPTLSLLSALVSTAFFYTINASTTNFTLRSWSCQWSDIAMDSKPHWGTLCRESKVGLYLSVFLIPVGLVTIGCAGFKVVCLRRGGAERGWAVERKGERGNSPAMS